MTMARRLLIKNTCYHIMTRGNQKQIVFYCEQDYLVYLALLRKFKRKYKFKLYAYCLMPNHVHLLGQIEDPPNLSKFMHGINRNYTGYFNQKYEKTGHLWQGRFKSKVISKNEYLLDCLNYIESNPLRSELTQAISAYPWSSYCERALGAGQNLIDLWDLGP